MNSVTLIGRLTKDPELKNGATPVCKFTLAIDRPTGKEEKQTDFPRVTAFGKTAENIAKFMAKGRLLCVQGRLQTGSYEKDGQTVFTTDVIAERVEFIDWGEKKAETKGAEKKTAPVPSGFSQIEEDIPF